jgi:hypothetical protein
LNFSALRDQQSTGLGVTFLSAQVEGIAMDLGKRQNKFNGVFYFK